MIRYIQVIFFTLIIVMSKPAAAQSGQDVDKVMQVMKEVQAFYSSVPQSFDIHYTYSNESTPGKVLDSLNGSLELSGEYYRYLLGGTETIHNNHYTVVLFKDDMLMYVSKADTGTHQANPLLPMRESLERTGISRCNIARKDGQKTIQIGFKEGAPYKQVALVLDTVSKRMISMQYVVKTALLMDTQDMEPGSGYDEYAIVQAVLNNYRQLPENKKRFDEKQFFTREGNSLKVTPAYKDYKIFIGSPNL